MIYITGSKGFIGTHLCRGLSGLCIPFTELGRNELANPNPEDTIIHLAATTTLSTDFVPDIFDNNVAYAWAIMQSRCRIIYASSTSASELTNPYAYTKRYLEYLGEKHGNAVGLRLFNVYGHGCKRGIIKAAIDAAINGTTLNIYGGHQVRDFIYIDDVIDRIIQAIEAKPGIYDVGTGIGTGILEAIREVGRVWNKNITIKRGRINEADMNYSAAGYPSKCTISLNEGLLKMKCSKHLVTGEYLYA